MATSALLGCHGDRLDPYYRSPHAMTHTQSPALPLIGWREWLELPDLHVSQIKAKIDTGARSSALHAFHIERFSHNGVDRVRFTIHPEQELSAGATSERSITAEADLLDMREVKNSGGQAETRPVIQTTVVLGEQRWPIELTLTNRDAMGFRMLLGRQAVRTRFLIDAGRSYLQGVHSSEPPKTNP